MDDMITGEANDLHFDFVSCFDCNIHQRPTHFTGQGRGQHVSVAVPVVTPTAVPLAVFRPVSAVLRELI